MEFLGRVFGDPAELLKRVLTHTTARIARPALQELFLQKMDTSGRIQLGDRLVAAGNCLRKGEVASASDELAQALEAMRFS
jgi:hypothetical protein